MKKLMKILKSKIIGRIILIFSCLLLLLLIILNTIGQNYVINVTPSIPIGIYRVYDFDGNVKKGDLVMYTIEKKYQDLTALKGTDFASLKPVAGIYGDKIEIKNRKIFVNGEEYGEVVIDKRFPIFNGEIKENEVLTLSKKRLSFDGRYYGAIAKDRILKKGRLVYEFQLFR